LPLGITMFVSLVFRLTLIGGSIIFEGAFEVRPNEVTQVFAGITSLRILRVYRFICTMWTNHLANTNETIGNCVFFGNVAEVIGKADRSR
jgi:hypothetical protein